MKSKSLILIIVLTLFSQNIFGQDNTSKEFNNTELIGVWHLTLNLDNENLIFVKSTTKNNFGERIELLENGDFIDAYSAPCGNDPKRHYSKGKWSLNKENMILKTSIPINYNGSVYKIVELKNDQLILCGIITE